MKETRSSQISSGSLSESIQFMTDWKRGRYGISSAKPFGQKLSRAIQIVSKNKFAFSILLFGYLALQTLGNSALLYAKWSIDKDVPKNNFLVLVQITASVPMRILHSLLNMMVLYIVMCSIKRRGHELILADIISLKDIISFKLILVCIVYDIILSSPLSVAQALVHKDIVLSLIYFAFGFVLNWLFGFAIFLVIEDQEIPTVTVFIWSAAAALSGSTFSSIATTSLFSLVATPLIILTPLLLVLQVLTFYETFGFFSPAEVHLATEGN